MTGKTPSVRPRHVPADRHSQAETGNGLGRPFERMRVAPEVEHTDPDGIDYGWVMQVTFIAALAVGVPIVAVASLFVSLPTWPERALFAVRVGAPVWLLISLCVYGYARLNQE
jgi:hypothetical protein